MAIYSTSFTEYTIGVQPSDWTERFNTGSTWNATSSSGLVFLRNTAASDGLYFLSWDDIDADADRDDVEVLVKTRFSSLSGAQSQIRVRGSGTAGSPTAYTVLYSGSNGRFEFFKDVAGVGTLLTTLTASLSTNTFYWFRYRINVSDIKFKWWADGAAEPGAWQTEITDGDITAAGWVGLGAFTATGNRDFDAVAIGTNGDTAAFAASADARVTQQATLVLSAANSDTRITQAAMLVLGELMDAAPTRITQVATLALVGFDAGLRVTQTAVLVLADQVNCLTKWAQTWTITRTDGEVFAFTSHDMAITFRGVVHSPCDSLSASAVELSSLTGSTGSMELMGIISDTSVTEADLYNGLFDSASIEVWMVPWDNENGDIPFRLIAGQTGKLSHGVEGFEFEVLANATKLKQKSLIDVYTPGCRYNFGTQNDPRCPVDLTTIDVTGSVTGLAVPNAGTSSTRRIFTDSSRTEADGFFEFGKVTWTSGANIGVVSEVKDFNAGTFVLWNATLMPIALNDTYDATPGCDKSRADHLVFNATMIDYGGFEDVPGTDAVLQTPDAKG